jgi:hypothetical protein
MMLGPGLRSMRGDVPHDALDPNSHFREATIVQYSIESLQSYDAAFSDGRESQKC